MKDPIATWWRGHREGRRLVSAWRRRVGFVVLVLVASGFFAYRSITEEARLRQFAERWLEEFTGGEAEIDQVRFDLFNGRLHLVGVRLTTPASARFDPRDNSLESRTVFRTATLFLRLRPLSIISGNLVVPEIIAVNPELTLVHRLSDGRGNWEVMLERRKARRKREGPLRLPVVRLRNARLAQYHLQERGRSGGQPQIVYAEARPLAEASGVYEVAITKILESPDSQEMVGEGGHLQIDMRTLAISGQLPTMTIKELLFTAPPEIVHWLDVLALHGYVRPDTFSYDPRTRGQAALTLRDASLSIPLEPADEGLGPEQRYIRLKEMAGTIRFDGARAEAELAGRFHGSRLEVKGSLVLPGEQTTRLDEIGFDLELKTFEVPLPRQDETADPSEVRFVRRWERLSKFVYEYDGLGNADLVLRLRKPPGAGKDVKFVEATLRPQGASGRYFRFPYRLCGLTGTVHFRPDGWVELKNLKGTHSTGQVVISGLVGGYVSKECKLDIRAENVELDEDLLRCLSEQDQALCRRFQARARMDLRVELEREDYGPDSEPKPWQSVIEVTFTDGAVRFAGFPYPLERLTGRMRIAKDEFQIDDVCAARADARVCINGSARRSGKGPASVDLVLDARDVPLDKVLADALPVDARKRYERFKPAGEMDLAGRLFTAPDGERIEYDLTASLGKASLDLPPTTARLTDATATIRLAPTRLEVESLDGRFGEAVVELEGHVGMEAGDSSVSLHAACPDLPLDESLHAALPASLRKVWDSFQPRGVIGLDLRYDRPSPATQPAEGAGPSANYTVEIEPKDCQAVYAGFPLPLTAVRGRLVATPKQVDIPKITARHEQTELELTGRIDLSCDPTRVDLSIEATGLTFSEPLRQAVPWRLRRRWNEANPQGTVDLRIDKFTAVVQPGALTTWEFQGGAELHDVSIALGTELTKIDGNMTARGTVGQTFSLEGKVNLNRARVGDRLVTDVRAMMSRSADDPVFRVSDIFGQFCGGTIVGRAEVDYSPGGPKYGLSFSARDVSLGKFLNAKRKPGDEPVQLKGLVEGNLVLTGRFGDLRTRRGGGTILIREAQMFKVPLLLGIFRVIHLAIDDDNAFHNGTLSFIVDGDELILDEIDLRGKAFSMVGAGRVRTPTQAMHLILLVGSPLRLPRVEVLSELLEGFARELMEVHVEGTLDKPTFRAEIVRSVSKTLETILNARRTGEQRR